MRILITGATGFVGGHLIEQLWNDGERDLHGCARGASWPPETWPVRDKATLHSVDLELGDDIKQLLVELRPDCIYHLAGYANAGRSFSEPAKAWAGNTLTTFQLYDAVAKTSFRGRILLASSGLIYGNPPSKGRPFAETDPLFPASPYASSKAAADLLSYQVTCHPGLDVVRVRCFNQIGPRQSAEFATANFARQIAAIESGRQSPILETGDLSGQRDLTDVRDMVRAFVLLMSSGRTGEAYNAGSGNAHSMREIVNLLLQLTDARVEVRERGDVNRKDDTSVSRADIRKLQQQTGWIPSYSLDRTISDLLDYWRQLALPMLERA